MDLMLNLNFFLEIDVKLFFFFGELMLNNKSNDIDNIKFHFYILDSKLMEICISFFTAFLRGFLKFLVKKIV